MGLVALGGKLAVSCHPKSAYAGLNSLVRAHHAMSQRLSLVGPHATGGYKPRQVREEAAVSDPACVVGRLRPNDDNVRGRGQGSMKGAQPSQHPYPASALSEWLFHRGLPLSHDPFGPVSHGICRPWVCLIDETIMTRRYNDFSTYLRQRFGCRVQKITIDAGFSCPNRDGTLSFSGCLFCDGQGSGTGAAAKGESIRDQIQQAKARVAARYKAKKFLAYFQAFTNTYASCETLRKRYDEAVADPDVVGLAIGTRPDCVDEEKLRLIEGYTATHMVWMEYGLQSMHNRTLRAINRGHTFEDFVRTVQWTQGRNIMICAHVILGLPGESRDDVLDTASALAALGIHGIKIHSLYILQETPLARLYQTGVFKALDEDTYVDWVVAFLERLPPEIIVQRLTGDPNPTRLLAPSWTLQKQRVLSLIWKTLEDRDTCQAKGYTPGHGSLRH